jgi:hypothetical protein
MCRGKGVKAHKHIFFNTFLTPRRMILVGSGGIWWDLVGSGGIWWDLVGSGGIWWDLMGSSDSMSFPPYPTSGSISVESREINENRL